MKSYQKLAVSGFCTIAMLLSPMQAAFADEAITSTNHSTAQEVQSSNTKVSPRGLIYGTVGDPTTDIYFNGVVTVNVTAPSGGDFVVYAITPGGSYNYLNTIKGSGSLRTQLYGYHKIYVTSSFSGTFTVNY
ncbi:hypothetical protein J2Z69_001083 [Paenibacillus shirakamiensis]|uniref:Uncharacterized protein n=1 Tax=Paenibacillus shirakamiensis TaxID=1265935 RepID=A0ABS4JEC7_9BACL|nr:hypothetical protein [Paenibacillus shirakamiensis]MBP2000064.1 hypothetical protein [Paenibacillus shirakamiensis]